MQQKRLHKFKCPVTYIMMGVSDTLDVVFVRGMCKQHVWIPAADQEATGPHERPPSTKYGPQMPLSLHTTPYFEPMPKTETALVPGHMQSSMAGDRLIVSHRCPQGDPKYKGPVSVTSGRLKSCHPLRHATKIEVTPGAACRATLPKQHFKA